MRRCSTFGILLALCAFRLSAADHFVSLTSPNPTLPYSNWDSAAHVIQDAIDVADPGDRIIVTNGLYNSGGRVTDGTLTNRVVIDKALTVQSVNGPDATIIEGYQLPGITNGPGAVRCVSMASNTVLIGFTITHGATDTNNSNNDAFAGGVRCLSPFDSVLSNCVIINNSAFSQAGGISWGTLNNCVIANNSDTYFGGGAVYSPLTPCLITNNYSMFGTGGIRAFSGAGVPLDGFSPTIANFCIIMGNSSGAGFGPTEAYGGAADYILNNCLITGNKGDGAIGCRVFNCTIVSNSVGIEGCQVLNSIIYYNDTNYPGFPNILHSCTTPLHYDFGANITNAPLFVDPVHGDFHLQPNSPCINAGYNGYLTLTNNEYDTTNIFQVTLLTNDFDGNPRLVGGTVDLGAYEFQSPASKISYAWLQQYGLALDGSVDNADPDGDGMSNWQEWRAGTLPLDDTSLLLMAPPSITAAGPMLTWQSQTNVTYYLQRAAQPVMAFSTIQSNIVGLTATSSYIDTNTLGSGPFFYRVGVQ
jgi:hypothetical protein